MRTRQLIVLAFIALPLAILILGTTASAQWPDGGPDTTIDPKAKTEAINSLVKDLNDLYVFPDVGNKVAAMLAKHRADGDYSAISSGKAFAQLLNEQVSGIARDQHLHVIYSSQVIPNSPLPSASQPDTQTLLYWKKINYGFQEVKRLEGNLGYLKVTGFVNAESGGPTVAAAMSFLANTDALIIDLRENSGGNPGMVALLCSYFFSGSAPVHLNDSEHRKQGTTEFALTQWWVLPYVPGPRYTDKEVYVLTSHETPSAAEEFSYNLQVLKRATVVGESTWGGANSGEFVRLGDHFKVFMPTGHAVNPITKTNWDGIGVKPDIAVPQQDALKVAEKTALEHLIAKTTDEQGLDGLKHALGSLEAAPAESQKR